MPWLRNLWLSAVLAAYYLMPPGKAAYVPLSAVLVSDQADDDPLARCTNNDTVCLSLDPLMAASASSVHTTIVLQLDLAENQLPEAVILSAAGLTVFLHASGKSVEWQACSSTTDLSPA